MTADGGRPSSITDARGGRVPTLAELEEAELEAQRRRAAAEVEADRRVQAARAEARAIEAAAPRRMAEAVALVRDEIERQARDDVTAIEAAIAALGTADAGSRSAADTERFEHVVERVVACVLLEAEGP